MNTHHETMSLMQVQATSDLHRAAERGDLDVVKAYVRLDEQRVFIDAPDMTGNTPLARAVMRPSHEQLEVCRALIGAQADVNALARDSDGQTRPLLSIAAQQGNAELCEVLLSAGADVNARLSGKRKDTPCRDTALMRACHAFTRWPSPDGHEETIGVLLKHGADVNVELDGGRCALMLAAQKGELAVVRALIKAGATQAAQAYDVAGNIETRELLGPYRRHVDLGKQWDRQVPGPTPAPVSRGHDRW